MLGMGAGEKARRGPQLLYFSSCLGSDAFPTNRDHQHLLISPLCVISIISLVAIDSLDILPCAEMEACII